MSAAAAKDKATTSTTKLATPAPRRTAAKPAIRTRKSTAAKAAERSTRERSTRREARRQTARQAGQLGMLTLMIVLGLIGLAVHVLWIAVIILMTVLWGYLASELRGSRSNRAAASDVVAAVGDGVRGLADSASSVLSDVGLHEGEANG